MQLINGAAVILDVDDADDGRREIGQILPAADVCEVGVFFKETFQRDGARILSAVDELDDGVIDAAVHGVVKMLELKNSDTFSASVVDEQSAEQRLFHFLVMRHDAVFRLGGIADAGDIKILRGCCHKAYKLSKRIAWVKPGR